MFSSGTCHVEVHYPPSADFCQPCFENRAMLIPPRKRITGQSYEYGEQTGLPGLLPSPSTERLCQLIHSLSPWGSTNSAAYQLPAAPPRPRQAQGSPSRPGDVFPPAANLPLPSVLLLSPLHPPSPPRSHQSCRSPSRPD